MKVNFVFSLIILFALPVMAQEDEIFMGYVNDAAILERLPAVKEVQRILDQETEVWDAQFKEAQQGLKDVADSLAALEKKLDEARLILGKGLDEGEAEELPDAVVVDSVMSDSTGSTDAPADSLAVVSDSLSGDSTALTDSVGAAKKAPPVDQAEKVVVQIPPDTLKILADIGYAESELERSKKKLLAQYKKIYGENGILARRNTELSQSLLEKIERVVRRQGESHQTAMIFDSSILLYVDQDNNLTEPVLESLGLGEDSNR